MNPVSVGKVIAARRKELNMTQRQLAEELHVTDKAVSRWERGANYPDLNLIGQLALVLKIDVSDLLSIDTVPSNEMDEVLKAAAKISDEEHKNIKKTIKNNLLCFAVLGFIILAGVICLELTSVMGIDNEQWTTIRDLIWGFMRYSFFVIPLWAVRSLIMFKKL